MKTLGNILWHFPFLGFLNAISVFIFGLILTATVVAAPIGLGLIEYSKFLLSPFTHAMVSRSDLNIQQNKAWKAYSTVIMALYLPFGIFFSIIAVLQIALLFLTIVGIPLAVVLAKSLGTYFNPVNKKCVRQAVVDELENRKAQAEVATYLGDAMGLSQKELEPGNGEQPTTTKGTREWPEVQKRGVHPWMTPIIALLVVAIAVAMGFYYDEIWARMRVSKPAKTNNNVARQTQKLSRPTDRPESTVNQTRQRARPTTRSAPTSRQSPLPKSATARRQQDAEMLQDQAHPHEDASLRIHPAIRALLSSERVSEGEGLQSGRAWPFTITFTSFDPVAYTVSGQVDLPSLGSTLRLQGQVVGDGLVLRTTQYIKRGSAVIGANWVLRAVSSNRLEGTWKYGGQSGRLWINVNAEVSQPVGGIRDLGQSGLTQPTEELVPRVAPGGLIRTFSDPSGNNSGHFGSMVIGFDGYIFVGASPMSGGGVVYTYNPKDGALTRTFSTPTPERVNGGFGRVLAHYKGNLLVGAWQEPSGLNLYDIQSGQRMDAYPNKGGLGISAAVDGAQILAGATGEGIAYLFDGRNKTILQKYVPPVPTINFGRAVTFAGGNVVVGATGYKNDSDRSGAAFVFDRITGNHLHTLLDPHPAIHGYFGHCVAASGNDILIGKFNSSKFVYLYDGSTFTLKDTFEDPQGHNNGFGRSIAVWGDYVLIGSPAEDISAYNSGAAFLFDIKTCDLLHTYLDPTPIRNGGFGTSVAFFEGNVLIGEWGQSSAAPGEVHLFKMIGTIPIVPAGGRN